MNEETRKFFEKLAGVMPENEQDEFTPQMVRASKQERDEEKINEETNAPAINDDGEEDDGEDDDGSGDESGEVGEARLVRASAAEAKKKVGNEVGDFDESEGQLAIDVYQTPTDIIIESPVAGVSADNIDLEISPESVTIKGKRSKTVRIEKKDYLHQECYWGKFSRTIILPQEIDADNATAAFKSGVLKITLPKVSRAKTKKVKVRFE